MSGPAAVYDIRDHGGIQKTLDLIASFGWPKRGGICYIPKGEHYTDAPLVARRGRLTIQGEGSDTVIRPRHGGDALIIDGETAHDLRVQDLQIIGGSGGTSQSPGAGISCVGSPARRVGGLRFLRTFISHFETGIDFAYVDFPFFQVVGASECTNGMRFVETTQIKLDHCFIANCKGTGVYVDRCLGFYMQGPGVQNCGGWHVHLRGSHSCLITRCDIEDFQYGILVQGSKGVGIEHNVFLPKEGPKESVNVGVFLEKNDDEAVRWKKNDGVTIRGNAFFGANGGAHTVGVTVQPDSTLEADLAFNCQAWRDSTEDNEVFTMYRRRTADAGAAT